MIFSQFDKTKIINIEFSVPIIQDCTVSVVWIPITYLESIAKEIYGPGYQKIDWNQEIDVILIYQNSNIDDFKITMEKGPDEI